MRSNELQQALKILACPPLSFLSPQLTLVLEVHMSQNLDLSNEHPQPASDATAIGVTYVPSSENSTLRRVMEEAESQVILRALQHTGWNRKRAAAILKISYRGLLYKVRRHNITPNGGISAAVPAQGSKIE
jgi:DNA-binding NtrC family response regulator